MLRVRCSKCHQLMDVPDDAVGKKARCPCGHRFLLRKGSGPQDEEAATPEEHAFSWLAGTQGAEAEQIPPPPVEQPAPAATFFTPVEEPAQEKSPVWPGKGSLVTMPHTDPATRYPQLCAYLDLLLLIGNIVLGLSVLIATLFLVIGIVGAVRRFDPMSVLGGIGLGLLNAAGGLFFWFLVRAGVQLVRVILDIEESTRALVRLTGLSFQHTLDSGLTPPNQ